jgi:Tripartite tricarboxylate transporter family receptor
VTDTDMRERLTVGSMEGLGRVERTDGDVVPVRISERKVRGSSAGIHVRLSSHAVTDVATGRVSMIIEGYSGIAGAARSGSIKLIAVASAKRLPEFPDVPTVAETIPGFQATGWAVLVAPVGTAEAIIDKISEDLRKVTLDPELQKKLAPLGSYTNPMSPAEATAFVHRQQQTWQPVLDEIARTSADGDISAKRSKVSSAR